ncbi:GvpL/GvpF family gas vesicle protein [Krasilnikoviella flava]|uniref:Gas vesicle synthesis protein GvpL/GvpF n=1 Tax=Krasilnikoviella flava TaxID=526729 RepID=A0A1T5L803_9MICO|nr:GvpL/GvpF family gas vesicle protein [Krasilnikoviella flava]SKC72111.1 Gas vesicle synthesis protein GvpL/GvpF [Krasilnikoviella flava]
MTGTLQPTRTRAQRLYLYGLVPSAARPPDDLAGIDGNLVRVIRLGRVAALVSDAPSGREPGLPDDVRVHAQVLDTVARAETVLPMRFGATTSDESLPDAVPVEHQARHADALRALAGTVQFTVFARYREEAVLAQLVAEDPEIRHLRSITRGRSEVSTYHERLRLGELVVAGLERRRARDEQLVVAAVSAFTQASRAHEVTRSGDVADLALLVRREDAVPLEDALEGLAAQVADRMSVRLVGPQAPYDFAEEV